ncbi:MAG: PASTA domain-containing protein [Actinomycetes bacterium]
MSATGPHDATGTVVGDRYRLEELLGAGGTGWTYLATDLSTGGRVAVKLLDELLADDEPFLRRFRTEARSAAALDDPNVLAVIEFGDAELPGRAVVPFVVTDVMEGGSLKSLLAAGHRLTPSQALVVGLDAARALDHAHRRGLVHRHVDPSCLLFDADGHARLADFGLARAVGEVYEDRAVGPYASPEQAEGERVGGRSDVYSLALVMVEAVTGEVPAPEGDLELDAEFGALRSVLERAGRHRAEERPDAEELEIALMAAAEALPRPEPLPLVGTGPLAAAGPVVTSRAEAEVPPPLEPAGAGAEDASAAAGTAAGADEAPLPEVTRRTGAALVASVSLLVVAGAVAVWWFALRTPTYEVPRLVGTQVATAAQVARASSWRVARTLVREDGTRPGEVVAQAPAPGTQLAEGGTLRLTVSLGASLADFPAGLSGQPLEQVETALTEAGFKVGRTTRANDEKVAAGDVVSATPAVAPSPKGQVPRGTVVALVVSDGPAPRVLPADMVGSDAATLRTQLESLGLVVSLGQSFSATVPSGAVVSTDPAPGTEVARGSTVNVVVSTGPPPVPVPNVVGKKGSDAVRTLQEAGFLVPVVRGSQDLPTIGTDPAPGTPLQPGATVLVVTQL